MLDALITSKTRIRLLVKFFLNPTMKAYLRQLADEFGESTNAVRVELNRLTEAGILESQAEGNVIQYKAKSNHPLFPEIKSIVTKITGIDQLIESVIERLGNLENAYLVGDYASGKDTGVIDILLIGDVNKNYLTDLIEKAEELVQRKIRYLVLSEPELKQYTDQYTGHILLLWSKLK
jgi:DNA-binding transcriptional ArsR family regulator